MNCDEEALTERLDGELGPERRAALDAHLAGCASCRKTWERLKGASAAFQEHAALPPAHADLKTGVRPGGARGAEGRGRGFSAVLTAVMMGIIVMLFLGKAFRPQISGVFNQIMGMISGAASTIGSGN